MEEPTAALTPQETDELLDLLGDMARRECSVIFISHKLNEVRRVSLKDKSVVPSSELKGKKSPMAQAPKWKGT